MILFTSNLKFNVKGVTDSHAVWNYRLSTERRCALIPVWLTCLPSSGTEGIKLTAFLKKKKKKKQPQDNKQEFMRKSLLDYVATKVKIFLFTFWSKFEPPKSCNKKNSWNLEMKEYSWCTFTWNWSDISEHREICLQLNKYFSHPKTWCLINLIEFVLKLHLIHTDS